MLLKLHASGRLALLLAVTSLGAFPLHAQDAGETAEEAYVFGVCAEDAAGRYGTGPIRSLHVPMRDGVRIALDVVLPEGLAEGEKVPTVLQMTPHWLARDPRSDRLIVGAQNGGEDRMLMVHLDPETGELNWDERLRERDGLPGIDFRRTTWPHGDTGEAFGHAALFQR